MTHLKIGLALLAISLVSCVGIAQRPTFQAETKSMPVSVGSAQPVLLKTRDFLNRTKLPDDLVYGMVVFTAAPSTQKQLDLYAQVCKTWEATFVSQLSVPSDLKSFVTYWPVTRQTSTCTNPSSYSQLLADELLQLIGLHRKGVFLVAYNTQTKKSVVMDVGVLVPSDMPRAFDTWKNELVVSANGSWNTLFTLSVLREKFRYYLNSYGDEIMKLH